MTSISTQKRGARGMRCRGGGGFPRCQGCWAIDRAGRRRCLLVAGGAAASIADEWHRCVRCRHRGSLIAVRHRLFLQDTPTPRPSQRSLAHLSWTRMSEGLMAGLISSQRRSRGCNCFHGSARDRSVPRLPPSQPARGKLICIRIEKSAREGLRRAGPRLISY